MPQISDNQLTNVSLYRDISGHCICKILAINVNFPQHRDTKCPGGGTNRVPVNQLYLIDFGRGTKRVSRFVPLIVQLKRLINNMLSLKSINRCRDTGVNIFKKSKRLIFKYM